jgi:hypothetical protein
MWIEPEDYDAMSAWVRRVLSLPFDERLFASCGFPKWLSE